MTTRCLLLIAILSAVALGQNDDKGVNRVEAVINGKAITHYDVRARLLKDEIAVDVLAESEKKKAYSEALMKMADEMLREEAALKSGIVLDPEQLRNRKQAEIDSKYGTRANFEDFLSSQGLTEAQFDTDFKKRQEMNAWLGVVSGRGGAKLNRNLRPLHDISVTPREMHVYYDLNKTKVFTLKDEVDVRVIQKYFKTGARGTKKRVKQSMMGLKAKLRTKADFAVLAQKNSDHISKDKGGLIQNIELQADETLPEPVEVAVFAEGVQPGQVIGPIEHVTSFWLVKVESRKHARVISFDEAQQRINNELRFSKMNKAIRLILRELLEESYISPPGFRRRLETYMGSR